MQLAPLVHLPHLHELVVTTLEDSLGSLACLTGLRTLRVMGGNVTNLGPLAQLASLEGLTLGGLRMLDSLAPLGSLTGLRRLALFDVTEMDGSPDYSFLASLELEELDLEFAHAAIDFSTVSSARLRSVHLFGTAATNLDLLGSPGALPAEFVVDGSWAADDLERAAAALCARGWCMAQSGSDPELASVPLCEGGCGTGLP